MIYISQNLSHCCVKQLYFYHKMTRLISVSIDPLYLWNCTLTLSWAQVEVVPCSSQMISNVTCFFAGMILL